MQEFDVGFGNGVEIGVLKASKHFEGGANARLVRFEYGGMV